MKAEIIAVGTELLLGQIANTNAQWISKKLAAYGVPVYFHNVVGDNMARVQQTFQIARERSDIVLITGGLGPTDDDMTREAAQKIIKQKLVEDQQSMAKIEDYFQRNNRKMTLNNRKQSRVFENARVFPNPEGMAPGQAVEEEGCVWIFLPGVPREMKKLMEDFVLPYLQKTFQLNSEIASEMMRFIGIGESTLEHELYDIIEKQTNPTIAPLAGNGEVALRLTASGSSPSDVRKQIRELKNIILSRVGEYYYGSDEITIAGKVLELLRAENMSLCSAESLTGGKFIEGLISLPGASKVCQGSLVAYTPEAKHKVIEVPKFIIDEFGTISRECAETMALNAQSILESDVSISFTGAAGPDPSEGHEPGIVFIGIQVQEEQPVVKKFHFDGSRDKIRSRAVNKGYELLFHLLKNR
ncbi:competence/damage-inducible protein A [Halobacillus salinarum]|uniref:Putative competence-damage inducible protein n=1 Tax=Halobacillus salinarum TaxID=2932257 RepID=A0ABY4EHN8_9BACI|nr:competence/damage-inducible protein A [Halobacillus salinarum]UOQ42992.1 competence/damage-inducible protein A [Halobacillus salinarum]